MPDADATLSGANGKERLHPGVLMEMAGPLLPATYSVLSRERLSLHNFRYAQGPAGAADLVIRPPVRAQRKVGVPGRPVPGRRGRGSGTPAGSGAEGTRRSAGPPWGRRPR